MNIYLIGFMGAGKSTYGKKLATSLGYDFVDIDANIEANTQKTIAQLFENEGEEAFREIESKTIKSISKGSNKVVSTGGGAPCFHNNMQWMNENGLTVYLKLLEPQLLKRLKKGQSERPLIADLSEKELHLFIHEKLNERSKFYAQAAFVIQPEQFQPKFLVEYLQARV